MSKNPPSLSLLLYYSMVRCEDKFTSDKTEFSAMTNISCKLGGVSSKIPIKQNSSLHRYITPPRPKLYLLAWRTRQVFFFK